MVKERANNEPKYRFSSILGGEEIPVANEFEIQSNRIRRVFDEMLHKLKTLAHLPVLLENNGEILRQHLQSVEVDFILMACQEYLPNALRTEISADLSQITNILDKISLYEKSMCSSFHGSKMERPDETSFDESKTDIYISHAIDLIMNSKSLLDAIFCGDLEMDHNVTNFIDAMLKLREIVDEKLALTGVDELRREEELKNAYRDNVVLVKNIKQMEQEIERQRVDMTKELNKKTELMFNLNDRIEKLKEKFKQEVNQIVYESEKSMMEDTLTSEQKQIDLAEEAKQATADYERLLEKDLADEKVLRTKRFKVETQLASWVAKYDTDIGEKQAEFEQLQKKFDDEKEEMELLREKFDEQEEEYFILMNEKEQEERRIFEEKAFLFLQNRSARRIQRAWREYKARKLARKKARKSKKKGGSAGGKKSGGKKGKLEKRELAKKKKVDEGVHLQGGIDPNAVIEGKFNKELLEDIKDQDAFTKKDMQEDLLDL